MNIKTGNWDQELVAIFGIDTNDLPDIVDSNSDFEETDLFGLFPHKIPTLSVLGDSRAALFAHDCFEIGDSKVTLGTGSPVMLNIGRKLPNNFNSQLNTSPAWSIDGQRSYVLEGNINYVDACVIWLEGKLHLTQDPAETANLALTASPNDRIILIPALVDLGAPYWLLDVKAAFADKQLPLVKKN